MAVKLSCDGCRSKYRLSENILRKQRVQLKCKRCAAILRVDADGSNARNCTVVEFPQQAQAKMRANAQAKKAKAPTPAPPNPPAQRLFYVAIDGQTHGPYPDSLMEQLIAERRVVRANHICEKGAQTWSTIGDHVLFAPLFGPSRRVSKGNVASTGNVVDFKKATETNTDRQPIVLGQNLNGFVGQNTRVFMTNAGLDARRSKLKIAKWVGLVFALLFMSALVVFGVALSRYEAPEVVEMVMQSDGSEKRITRKATLKEKATSQFDFLLGGSKKKTSTPKKGLAKRRTRKKTTPEAFDAPRKIAAPKGSTNKEAADIRSQLQGTTMGGMKKLPSKIRGGVGIETIAVASSDPLDAKAISNVVKRHRSAFTFCAEQSLKNNENISGRADISLRVEPTGKVSKARVTQQRFRGTSFAKCVARSSKKIVFPSFDGAAFDLEVPFVLQ